MSEVAMFHQFNKDCALFLFHMPDAQPAQVGSADRHSRTVIHVVDKNVNAAPGVLVRYSALPHNIEHRGVFLEGREATYLPRCLRSFWNFELLWHRLIVKGVTRRVASLGCCFLS